MRKIESIFTGVALLAVIAVTGGVIWNKVHTSSDVTVVARPFPDTKYGSFLAAQHAIYVNDFDAASDFSQKLSDADYLVVSNVKMMSDFLNGRMPENAAVLKKEKGLAARFIYDAYLVTQGDWKEFHNRHKTENVALVAPLRIWSAIANDWRTNTFKFIDGLSTSDTWKNFVRGQIYAELGQVETAVSYFEQVSSEFMNINDYLYLMSFYTHHGMSERATALRSEFTSRPSGMFLLNYDQIPDWSMFSGYANQLAFSLVQTVSHTQVLMYSDMAVLMLRFAQLVAPEYASNSDAINYYLGQYFYTNGGNWASLFAKIAPDSPFYLFSVLRQAEKSGDMTALASVLDKHPLFVPAMNKLIAYNIKRGDKNGALSIVKRALSDDNLDEAGRAFFLKSRAQIHFVFGDYDAAQRDLTDAMSVLEYDAEFLSLQAKIWAAQNRDIERAYNYAMTLVTKDPTDILAWDTLGYVVSVREGAYAALDVLERVGEISETHSSLFLHLGDIYVSLGQSSKARDAYMRAIDLSDDGLVVVPEIERKLRKLK